MCLFFLRFHLTSLLSLYYLPLKVLTVSGSSFWHTFCSSLSAVFLEDLRPLVAECYYLFYVLVNRELKTPKYGHCRQLASGVGLACGHLYLSSRFFHPFPKQGACSQASVGLFVFSALKCYAAFCGEKNMVI